MTDWPWTRQPSWLILATGFGPGIRFLTTWQAWRSDERRARLLHFVAVEPRPVDAEALLCAVQARPELAPLARALAAQWHGLLPGFHRFSFDDGRVLLTLCIGEVQPMLRAQRFEADDIVLDGLGAQALRSADTLKAVSRFARQGTRIAAPVDLPELRAGLLQNGFALDHQGPGLRGVFAPSWTVRRRQPAPVRIAPGHCAVIGAGLAGAAVAASLARRGWRVTVLDAADQPASGASGLPVGMLAPHVSPDDALLSRLTRAGIRATWGELERLLDEGRDWRATGVLERRPDGDVRVPAGWRVDGPNESWPAHARQLEEAGLPEDSAALWHRRAAWVRPARLVAAWLGTPGVEFKGGCEVARVERKAGGWVLHDAAGPVLAEADRVVIAAGFQSGRFASGLPLQPVRGQVAWGHARADDALPGIPINGDGHLIARVPDDQGDNQLWLAGATFDRDRTDLSPSADDARTNRDRLARLSPPVAATLAPQFEREAVNAWVGVRCASGDRRPLVGPVVGPLGNDDGLWACTALGSRGLSFAALCAELLAAQWHGEPLALPANLAQALDTQRR